MSNQLASLLSGGPAKVTLGRGSFITKTGVVLAPELETFEVPVDTVGIADERVSQAPIIMRATPSGVIENLDEFYRVLQQRAGDYLVHIAPISAINTTSNQVTAPRHLLITGDRCYLNATPGATKPAVITETTVYFARVVDEDIVTLHPTLADADAGTNAIDFADDGTGDLCLIRELQLVIHTTRGKKITFHNVAITTPPTINGTAGDTLFGEVVIEAFPRNLKAWSDEESRYTIEDAAYVDEAFDPADIVTQCYALTWGEAAPWVDFSTEAGVQVEFPITTSPKGNDCDGIVNRQIETVRPAATFTPIGVSEAELLSKFRLQGSGTGRGKSLNTGSADLVISGTGLHITLYGAQLRAGEARFNRKDYRANGVRLISTLTFDEAGAPNPLARVATAAPVEES